MSYFRASTGNDQGWRPGTVTLGNEIRHAGPDWKTVAAQHDAMVRAGKQIHAARQHHARRRMNAIDAAARGDRTRVRMPRMLSGLGDLLSNATQMVHGAQYVFHFTYGGLGIRPGMDAVTKAVAADSNFQSPVASQGTSGIDVRFIYNGPGTSPGDNIGNYGAEMQNVINSFSVMGFANSVQFAGGEGGPLVVPNTPGSPVFIGPDGVLRDSAGNVVSANTSNPGNQDNNNDGSPFDWASFWEGMGLTAGLGTAIALGAAFLLFRN